MADGKQFIVSSSVQVIDEELETCGKAGKVVSCDDAKQEVEVAVDGENGDTTLFAYSQVKALL